MQMYITIYIHGMDTFTIIAFFLRMNPNSWTQQGFIKCADLNQ